MRKAQFAMEYLLVVAFSVVIILPIIHFLYQEYDDNRSEVHTEHMVEVGRELVYQAERIYYQGAPSRTSVEAYFPPGLDMANINSTHSFIEFSFDGGYDPPLIVSKVPINGSLRLFSGPHTIMLRVVDAGPVGPVGDYVEITDE